MSDQDFLLQAAAGALEGFKNAYVPFKNLEVQDIYKQADEKRRQKAEKEALIAQQAGELKNKKSELDYQSGIEQNKFNREGYLSPSDLPPPIVDQLQLGDNQRLRKEALAPSLTALNPKGETTLALREEQNQQKMEEQARSRITGVRGDISLKNVEAQRDAAITAYNRIAQVEKEGKLLNPIDYIDVLGQIYKARTGSAPTETVLNEARQQTLSGKFGKVYTLFTGNQAPATTKDIQASLKDMAAHMGQQADQLHEAYMKPHMDMPTSLSEDRANQLGKLARGLSFSEATGYQPEKELATPAIGGGDQGGYTPAQLKKLQQLQGR